MSQVFADIQACTRLPLNSDEKVVRQRSETYTEIQGCTGKGSDRQGTRWPSAVIPAIALHKGMMLLESFEQDCIRVTLRFTWKNYLHTQERKRQVGLPLWKDADCCCTPLCALWSLVELCPRLRWTSRYFVCPRLQRGHTQGRDQLMALAFVAC